MTFGDPRWLWALAALPLFAMFEWLAARRARAALERLVGSRLDGALLAQVRPGQRAMSAVLRLGAVACLIAGAARPEWGREVVRRGSMTKSRAPLCTPLSRWWKKIGCVSRALEPQRRITSVSSISA